MTNISELITNLSTSSSHLSDMAEISNNTPGMLESTKGTIEFGAYMGAGFAMLGATGVGIGQGYTAGEAVEGLARNPKMETKVRMTMLIGAAIAESSAIYALIIAILLIFVAPNMNS